MLLSSSTGSRFELSPVGYQYPYGGPPTAGRDTDANWLLIRGIATRSDGKSSEFVDPCLMTTEAHELANWLRAAAAGRIEPTNDPHNEPDGQLLMFTEPNLAWSVESRDPERTSIRVHLSLESAPAWAPADHELFATFLLLDLHNAELSQAAAEWERELAPYPVR